MSYLEQLALRISAKMILKSFYIVLAGIIGTTTNVVDSDYVPGVHNSGLYLHGAGKVALTGSETSCWTNLQHCTSGMTVSIWLKLESIWQHNYFVGSAAQFQEGFNIYLDGPSRRA